MPAERIRAHENHRKRLLLYGLTGEGRGVKRILGVTFGGLQKRAVLLVLSVLFLVGQSYNPFIYFRF